MLTGKDYCDYETCVALEEVGYVGTSRYYYTQRDHKFHYDAYNKFYTVRTADAMGYVLAIHLYDAQKWLREEKQIEIVVHSFDYVGEPYFADIHMYREVRCACSYADSYEEALSEGVRASIKILQDEQKENN